MLGPRPQTRVLGRYRLSSDLTCVCVRVRVCVPVASREQG